MSPPPLAGEMIQVPVLAMRFGLTIGNLRETFFPYLTAVEAVKLASGRNDVGSHAPAIIAGFVVSFVVSLVAIKLLLLIVRLKKFSLFAYYCLFAAAATFVVVLIK